MIDKIRRFYSA